MNASNKKKRIMLIVLFMIYVILLIVRLQLGDGLSMKIEMYLNIVLNVLITVIGAFITYGLAVRQGKKEILASELQQRELDNWNRDLDRLEKEKEELKKINLQVNDICDRESFYRNKVLFCVKNLKYDISNLNMYETDLFNMYFDLNRDLMKYVIAVHIKKYDVIDNKNKLMDLYTVLHKESDVYRENFVQYCDALKANKEVEFEVPKRMDDHVVNEVMFLMKKMMEEVDEKIEHLKSQKPR